MFAMRSQVLALGLVLLLAGGAVAEDAVTDEEIDEVPVDSETGKPTHYWWNDVTAESQWEKPEYEYTDPETDRVYYVHPETKETSWDKYEELHWEQVVSEEEGKEGEIYYYNTATKVSQWEKPAMLAWRLVAVGSEEEGVQEPVESDDKDEL